LSRPEDRCSLAYPRAARKPTRKGCTGGAVRCAALIEATRDAFALDLLDCANEALVADFDAETKRICG
jgi:hypothetical protein